MALKTKYLKIEPITEKAFVPFGDILGSLSRKPDRQVSNNISWWSKFECTGKVNVSYVKYLYRHPPTDYELTRVSQHKSVTQAIIPLEAKPSIFICAPPTPWGVKPPLDSFRAFLLDGTAGVVMKKLCWHTLGAPAVYIVNPPTFSIIDISEIATQQELRNPGPYKYTFEVNLPETYNSIIKVKW